ncbi:MAG: hypothetical protein NZ108_05920 [Bacteroidia bacterium]|nr:hypothetical protein [Bacteroidia bacterium]
MEIELKLVEIVCIKSNEEEDELYCQVSGQFADKKPIPEIRLPQGEQATWLIKAGQSIGPNLALYDGQVNGGISIMVKFREEDAGGFISVTDDTLGSFSVSVSPSKSIEWRAGSSTNRIEQTPDGSHLFELTGAKSQYRIKVKLFEKIILG